MAGRVHRSLFLWALTVSHPLLAATPWAWAGPDGGAVHSLALQPGNSNVLYAGGESGVFKSLDGGANWTLLVDGPAAPVLAMEVDPGHTSTVYAYAGLANRSVFKTVDGGAHWTDVGQGLPDAPNSASVGALAVTAGTVYAGTSLGVFRSHDGGATWQELNQGLPQDRSISSLEIDPAQPSRIFAGLRHGLYRSTDGGAHWAPAGNSVSLVHEVEVSPVSPAIVYAGTGFGVFRSDDGGDTWQLSQASGSANDLAVHPTLAGTLYAAGTNGVSKSSDGGVTWARMVQGLTDTRVLSLAIDPAAPAKLWAGTNHDFAQGGVFQTTDAAAHWTYRSRGLSAGNVYSLAIDPHAPGTLYAALAFQGLARSRDRGLHWTALPVPQGGFFLDIEVDPLTPSVVYATTTFNGPLLKSTDGGDTWTQFGTLPSFLQEMQELEIDRANPAVFYGGGDGFYKSTDRGANWVRSPSFPDVDSMQVVQIEIAPSSPATLYSVAVEEVIGSPPFPRNLLFRSTDAGQTWEILNPPHEPTRLAISPSDARTVYIATLGEGIFRTQDGGNTWKPVGSQLQGAAAVAIAPGTPETLYAAAAGKGVFASTDGGATWTAVGEGLEGLAFTGVITLDPHDPGRLWTGVANRGLATLFEPDVCETGPTTLCLQNGRFRVEAAWTDFQQNKGLGQALPLTGETGAFWFFQSSNLELVVKVLDGRGVNGRFWVFVASLTSVELTLTVTDTQTGKQKVYQNPSGKMASFGDTGTF